MRRAVRGLMLGGALGACSMTGEPDRAPSATERPVTALAQPVPALGEPLMISLAQARNYHHKADVLLREARLDQAIAALRQILSIPFPPGAAEGEDVALDARARLAKLLVTAGRLDEAMTVVDEGTATARRSSFFLANLYTARGEVLEARAQVLDGSDGVAAKAARIGAIEAFDRSIAINRVLMGQLGLDQVAP